MIEKNIHPEAFMWSSELQQTIIQRCKAVQYRLQEPLSCHTSFRIGGPAAGKALPQQARSRIFSAQERTFLPRMRALMRL